MCVIKIGLKIVKKNLYYRIIKFSLKWNVRKLETGKYRV